jgi:hypothetical protein
MVAHFQVKVGRLGFNGAAEEIVDAQGHGFTCLREEKSIIERSTGRIGEQVRRNEVMPPSNERSMWKETRVLRVRLKTRPGLWVKASEAAEKSRLMSSRAKRGIGFFTNPKKKSRFLGQTAPSE